MAVMCTYMTLINIQGLVCGFASQVPNVCNEAHLSRAAVSRTYHIEVYLHSHILLRGGWLFGVAKLWVRVGMAMGCAL